MVGAEHPVRELACALTGEGGPTVSFHEDLCGPIAFIANIVRRESVYTHHIGNVLYRPLCQE